MVSLVKVAYATYRHAVFRWIMLLYATELYAINSAQFACYRTALRMTAKNLGILGDLCAGMGCHRTDPLSPPDERFTTFRAAATRTTARCRPCNIAWDAFYLSR